MKQAILVGINDYPGWENDLTQCVNDATKWGNFLQSLGYQCNYIFNANATWARVTGDLKTMIDNASAEDNLVFFYSGHGSYEWDLNNDEADGWDEVLCLYDQDFLDDDFRKILNNLKSSMTVILDCCFGGTGTRLMSNDVGLKRKFRQPKTDMPLTAKRSKSFLSDEAMPEILLSACSDDEYSYEDENGGLFSRFALNILNELYPIDYNAFGTKISGHLPSRKYPQTPQIEGSSENKAGVMFGGKESPPDPPPTPDPPPPPDDSESWCTCFRAIKKHYLKLKRKLRSKNG